MMPTTDIDTLRGRTAPLDMTAADFRTAGHRLVDQIAGWLDTLASGRVTHDESPADVRDALRADRGLPETGMDAQARQESVENAFAVRHPRIVAGEHILLVDDVFTTGATASACSRVLLDAGAEQVLVLTLARPSN